jgi:hypothetical protein
MQEFERSDTYTNEEQRLQALVDRNQQQSASVPPVAGRAFGLCFDRIL